MLFWLSDNLSTSNHPNGNGRANPLPCTLDFHSNPLFAPPWVHMSLWDQGWLFRERRPTLFWQLKLPGKTFPALFLTDHPELQNNSAPPPPGAFPDRQHPPTHTHTRLPPVPHFDVHLAIPTDHGPYLLTLDSETLGQAQSGCCFLCTWHVTWKGGEDFSHSPFSNALWLYFSLNNAL